MTESVKEVKYLCTPRKHKGSGGITPLILNLSTPIEMSDQNHATTALSPGTNSDTH